MSNSGCSSPGAKSGFLRPRKKWRPFKKIFLRPFVWDFLSFFVCARANIPAAPPTCYATETIFMEYGCYIGRLSSNYDFFMIV